MKGLIFLFLHVLLYESAYTEIVDTLIEPSWKKEQWVEMPLNHFNLFDNRTWKMRYFINNEFYQEGMPLFIEIGGEWTVEGNNTIQGQMYELTKKHKGLLIATEHRYYGKSLPFSTDFSTKNLKYLQIEQALEDLVYLIQHLKTSIPGLQNSKVIVHGCSYAGMLASWIRSRFPNFVDITYASSAPLGVQLENPGYYESLNDVYANVSVSCIDTIRKGFNETERLLQTENGSKIVKDALRDWACGDVDEMFSIEIMLIMMKIMNVQYDAVQYEEVGCLVMSMDNDELPDFERLAKFVVLKTKDTDGCPKFPESEEKERQGIAWRYQICTEIGFFQTFNRENAPFAMEHTIEEAVEMCQYSFDETITEKLIRTGIKRVNRRYGGEYPPTTKFLRVHGTADPWRPHGVFEQNNSEVPIIFMKGSHCVDDTPRKDDPPEIIEGREAIRNIVSKWIEEVK